MSIRGKALLLLSACALHGYDLNVSVSSHNVYIGQPVRLTYTFAHKPGDDVLEYRFTGPALEHFELLSSTSETGRQKGKEVWQKSYTVAPLQSGAIGSGPASMNVAKSVDVKDQWGQWMPRTVWKPYGFDSIAFFVNPVPKGISAVGRFTVTAVTDKNVTDSGKPVTLTVTQSGCGNLKMAEPPELKIPGVSVFAEAGTLHAHWEKGCYYSEANQTYALVGNTNFTIPSIVLRAFDPKHNAVTAAQTLPITIRVHKPPQRKAKTGKEDVMPVWSLFLGVLAGVGIGIAGTLLFTRRKARTKKMRLDSLRLALIELFKHLDDPGAKKSAEAVEKHLYEGAEVPDKDAIADVIARLKRGSRS